MALRDASQRDKMDNETLVRLFESGSILLFLNAPPELEFGIDYNSWQTGPRFRGVKLIPPGLHFIYYRFDSGLCWPGAAVLMRSGDPLRCAAQGAGRAKPQSEQDSLLFSKPSRC